MEIGLQAFAQQIGCAVNELDSPLSLDEPTDDFNVFAGGAASVVPYSPEQADVAALL